MEQADEIAVFLRNRCLFFPTVRQQTVENEAYFPFDTETQAPTKRQRTVDFEPLILREDPQKRGDRMNIVAGEGEKFEILCRPAEGRCVGEGGWEKTGGNEKWGRRARGGPGDGDPGGRRPPPLPPLASLTFDLDPVQVTNMAQLHSSVFENCLKYYLNSIQDANSMSTRSLLTTVVRLISIRSSSCQFVVFGKNLKGPVGFYSRVQRSGSRIRIEGE